MFVVSLSTCWRSEVKPRTTRQRMWHRNKLGLMSTCGSLQHKFCACARGKKRKKDLRSKQTCIRAIQGSSPYEMPEVCQCVMSAFIAPVIISHFHFISPAVFRMTRLCSASLKEKRADCLHCMTPCNCVHETDGDGAICLLAHPKAQPW